MAQSNVYHAISHPSRRRMLSLLAGGDAPVHVIGREFPFSQQAVSKHLRILSDAGLTASRRAGQENIYYLNPAPLQEVRAWLDEFWTKRLDGLKSVAEEEDG